MTKKWKNK